MLEFDDVCELIAEYCESCDNSGNCDQSGCPRKKAYTQKMWIKYKAQFEEASE